LLWDEALQQPIYPYIFGISAGRMVYMELPWRGSL
jgi:hypothetical protein